MHDQRRSPLPCVIDTDMAPDDWMAVLYLLCAPEADVRAITVSATGECHAGPGVRNALRLLALAGKSGIPVAAGRTRPLRGHNVFPLTVRLGVDCRVGGPRPRARGRAAPHAAVGRLIQLRERTHEPLTIITLGPLTNLAELLLKRPDLGSKIAAVQIMGGALQVPGNIENVASGRDKPFSEWNIYIDPFAADVVLRSGVPTSLVPLDLTNQLPVTHDFVQRLGQQQQTPASRFVHRVFTRLRRLTSTQLFFWDQLTAVLATHSEIGQSVQRRLTVAQQPGAELGRVIEHPEGGLVRVFTHTDPEHFEQIFLDGINQVQTTGAV